MLTVKPDLANGQACKHWPCHRYRHFLTTIQACKASLLLLKKEQQIFLKNMHFLKVCLIDKSEKSCIVFYSQVFCHVFMRLVLDPEKPNREHGEAEIKFPQLDKTPVSGFLRTTHTHSKPVTFSPLLIHLALFTRLNNSSKLDCDQSDRNKTVMQ